VKLASPPQPSVVEVLDVFSASSRKHMWTARELFEIIQAAVTIRVFEAKHGEKDKRKEEMRELLRKMNIQGSNAVFQTRMKDMLAWHKARFSLMTFSTHI
jgi:hypothetical protein